MRPLSSTVTRQPRPAWACAISNPMAPPPRISRCSGRCGRVEQRLVGQERQGGQPGDRWHGGAAAGGDDDAPGRDAAGRPRKAGRRRSAGRGPAGPSRRALRSARRSRPARSVRWRRARGRAPRPSRCAVPPRAPPSGRARRALRAAWEAASSALLGTQPTFRQSPAHAGPARPEGPGRPAAPRRRSRTGPPRRHR